MQSKNSITQPFCVENFSSYLFIFYYKYVYLKWYFRDHADFKFWLKPYEWGTYKVGFSPLLLNNNESYLA